MVIFPTSRKSACGAKPHITCYIPYKTICRFDLSCRIDYVPQPLAVSSFIAIKRRSGLDTPAYSEHLLVVSLCQASVKEELCTVEILWIEAHLVHGWPSGFWILTPALGCYHECGLSGWCDVKQH